MAIPLFSQFVNFIKIFHDWKSCSYLTGVTTAQLWGHLSNMNLIERIQEVHFLNKNILNGEMDLCCAICKGYVILKCIKMRLHSSQSIQAHGRVQSNYAPSQWEKSLHCINVFHWLDWSLHGQLLEPWMSGLILGLCPANERQCYFVTTSLIGWAECETAGLIHHCL